MLSLPPPCNEPASLVDVGAPCPQRGLLPHPVRVDLVACECARAEQAGKRQRAQQICAGWEASPVLRPQSDRAVIQ